MEPGRHAVRKPQWLCGDVHTEGSNPGHPPARPPVDTVGNGGLPRHPVESGGVMNCCVKSFCFGI